VIGATQLVSCGGYNAPSCADCGDNVSFCNGECEWIADKCKLKNQSAAPAASPVIGATQLVSCGGHNATSCAECGDNASFCNGECKWIGNVCATTFQAQIRCGDSDDSNIFSTCDKCGGEENCNGECKWIDNVCETKNQAQVRCGDSNDSNIVSTCDECGDEENCNGECKWIDNVCQTKNQAQVRCGDSNDSNIVSTCDKCAVEENCNGQCKWIDTKCQTKSTAQVRCGDSNDSNIASTCDRCGVEENCNGECKWIDSKCKIPGMKPEHRTKIIIGVLSAVGAIGVAVVNAWLGRKKLCCCRGEQ